MRTTIELSPERYLALLRLAEERGEASMSRLIEEAVADFLEKCGPVEGRITPENQAALAAFDAIPPELGERIANYKEDVRSRWRQS